MQTLADAANPDHIHNYWKSTFLNKLSDEAIDLIVDQGNRALSPLTHVIIQLFNGQIGKVGNADSARRGLTLASRPSGSIRPRANTIPPGRVLFPKR